MNKYYIIKARDESKAVWKLLNRFKSAEDKISEYIIVKNYGIIK